MNRNTKPDLGYLQTDIHSHLILGNDEDLEILRQMVALQYKKVIISPHTICGTYSSVPENILGDLKRMKATVNKAEISNELEAASEYYLDELFVQIFSLGEDFITFGEKKSQS